MSTPIGYTTYYSISLWAQGDNPTATALNNNMSILDDKIHSSSLNTVSSSYSLSSSYAVTASYALNSSAGSSFWTSSIASGSTYGIKRQSNVQITGSLNVLSQSTFANGIIGNLTGTASYAANYKISSQSINYVLSDTVSPITASMVYFQFRMPYAFYLDSVKASFVSSSWGTPVGLTTIDISGSNKRSIFSGSLLTIDSGEFSSATAATTASIISVSRSLSDDEEMTVNILGVGTGARGLKLSFIGRYNG